MRLGRWPEAAEIAGNLVDVLAAYAFSTLDVTLEHGVLAGSLPSDHGDPFDGMLAAQAQIEDVPLISADRVFRRLGVRILW